MEIVQLDPSVVVVKYDRIRKELGDISKLAASMREYGQLQPIIVEKDLALVDGFRRLSAVQSMGWDRINAVYVDEMDEWTSRKLELETNIQRLDMSWEERAAAIAELDRLQRKANPNWSQAMTAIELGIHQRDVSQAKQITEMVKLYPEISKAKNMRKALNLASQKARQVLQKESVAAAPDYSDIEGKVLLGDSTQVIKDMGEGFIHAVITDPPFGVDYDHKTMGNTSDVNAYRDGKNEYLRLLDMMPDLHRVIYQDGWLVWFFGMQWYPEVREAMEGAGFHVDPIPLVWDRSDGKLFGLRPDKYFLKGYDVALIGLKGDPILAQQGRANILRIPPVATADRDLLVERPMELYAELIRRITIPGQLVGDFFMGSGSCPAAAASLGRDYIAVEANPERRAYGIRKIAANTPE